MHIDSEQKAEEAIEGWKTEPPRAQLRLLREAVESLEMSCMYYEQKGNEKGAARSERCLAIIKERIALLEQELAP